MVKKLILSVAGSGKTQLIINTIDETERILIITYTDENYSNLRKRIIQKFSYFPKNIKLYTYFSFLYNFCCLPYLKCNYEFQGICFKYRQHTMTSHTDINNYINTNGQLYHNQIALLILKFVLPEVKNRINKYFNQIFIDEIQDFASYDFDLILEIAKLDKQIYFVGDFYQHTFDTSRTGSKRKSLHKNLSKYKQEFESICMNIDSKTLEKSWRCSPSICQYISNHLDINILSNRKDMTNITILNNIKTDKSKAIKIFNNDSIVKLFYRDSFKYPCYANNWGNCKGINDYHDVCIVISTTLFNSMTQNKLKDISKNKLYVAISRTNNDLYIVNENFYKEFKL